MMNIHLIPLQTLPNSAMYLAARMIFLVHFFIVISIKVSLYVLYSFRFLYA